MPAAHRLRAGLGHLIAFNTFKITPVTAGRVFTFSAPHAFNPLAVSAVSSPQDSKHSKFPGAAAGLSALFTPRLLFVVSPGQ